MSVNEVKKICEDCSKLKKSIYENKIVFKATTEQKDAFYRMLDSLINRLQYFLDNNKELECVINTINTCRKLEVENDRHHVSFFLDKLKENLNKIYIKYKDESKKDTNFVAAVEPTIFYPIRIISEKLYRELLNQKYDESLDNFFISKKI